MNDMAEDELDKILIKFANSMTTNNAPSYGSMPNDGKILGKAKAAINAYTTNKIIEARIDERKIAWHETQKLEELYDKTESADKSAELHAVLRDVYRNQEERIKALNHRKELLSK